MNYPATGHVTIEIAVASADIRVSQQEGAVALDISGEQEPGSVEVERVEGADGSLRISIRERRRRMSGWKRRGGLDIHLQTPAETKLDIEGGSVDLRAKGTLGELRFSSGSGDARLDIVVGDVDLKGASGDLRVDRVGGHLRVHSASGDISAGAVDNGATLRTASGDIAITSLAGGSSITTLSGDVLVDTLHPTSLSVQAVSGDVEVGLVPGLPTMLDVSTLSGETRSDLDVSGTPVNTDASPVELKVNTVSGDVHIRRATKGLDL